MRGLVKPLRVDTSEGNEDESGLVDVIK